MSSNNIKKSSEEILESHKKCRKYDPTKSSPSSSPIKKQVVWSPMETTPERKKLKCNDCVIEPTSVPSTTIRLCTSDEDVEVLVFESSTSSSQSNVNIIEASSTTTSSKNDLISTSTRSSSIHLAIEEFQSTLSYLKNKIGLPGAESTPDVDVIGNKAVKGHRDTSLEPTTSKQNSDATICSSVISDSFISDDSKLSPLIQSSSTKQSSSLKQLSQSKQSSPSPSKMRKMEITTQKVEPRTVELTISMPFNVNCEALEPNENKSPVAVQAETKLKHDPEKKSHHGKVSGNKSSSFKSLRMVSGLENFEPHKLEAKTSALTEEGKKDSPAQLASESNDLLTTEQFDKYLKKLHDLFKTEKIKPTVKKKYMKSLFAEELSDKSSTASNPIPNVSSNTEMKNRSKNSLLTESNFQKQPRVLEQKLTRKKDINKIKSKLPTASVQLHAKEKSLSFEATDGRKEDETPKIFGSNSKETYVLASSGSNGSLEQESGCSLKLSENEQNYELSWVENRINHLHKLKNKLEKRNKQRTSHTNVYNIVKTDGSSERTYVITTNVDVQADESINNYILDGKEYVISHSQKLSSDSDQAIAAETVPSDDMGCICPSKKTLQSKLSSLCTESNLCLHCRQLVCVCHLKINEPATSSNKCIHMKAKQLVASKKESSESVSSDCDSLNGEYECPCEQSLTTEILQDEILQTSKSDSASKERLPIAVARTLRKSTQTDKISSSRVSSEEQIKKIVNIVLTEFGDKKNGREKSPEKSSSTQAIKISNVALQASKDVLCKNSQIETDESLSTWALKDSLPKLEENEKLPDKSSSMKPENKINDMGNNHRCSTENLPKDQSSLLKVTRQDLNSLGEISEFDDDEAESTFLSLKGNPSIENTFEEQPKLHRSTQTQISVNTGATQTHESDNNTGVCLCLKNGCTSQNPSSLPKLNQDLAKMSNELKKIDAGVEHSPATREKSSDVGEIVLLKDPNTAYRAIDVQVNPNISTATAHTSIEKLMKDGHANTDSKKYVARSLQASPGVHSSSAQSLDKLTKDKNENTDFQFVEPIIDPRTYRNISASVSANFHVPTVQSSDKLIMDNDNSRKTPLIDNYTYRNASVQASPSYHTAAAQTSIEKLMKDGHANADSKNYVESSLQTFPVFHSSSAQTLDKIKKDKNENTDLQFVEGIKDPKTYRDIGVQVSASFLVPTVQNKTPLIDTNTYRNAGVQASSSYHTAATQTSIEKLMKDGHANTDSKNYVESSQQTSPVPHSSSAQTDKLKQDKNENTDLQFVEPIRNSKTYRDIGVQVSVSFHVPTVQSSDKLKMDRNKNNNSSRTRLIDNYTYQNAGLQTSPSYRNAAAQTLGDVEKNNKNTHPKDTEPLKDPNTYKDIAVQVSSSFHSHIAQKKDKNENTHTRYRNVGVQASRASHLAAAQTLDEVKKNKSFNFNEAQPLRDPHTYRDFGVQVSESFHTPIELNMDESEHKNSSIATEETCPKCKQCKRKKKHRDSKKPTSDSTITTITTSLSDSTTKSTFHITCSCCKQKAFLSEINYMQNGNNLWAVCSRCFHNRRLYCGYNCRSVCRCWSYWQNTSRNYYSPCCNNMDMSTSTRKVQGVAYTVTLLHNDASKLQEYSASSLEDVIKVQKGWTPSHLKYLKNLENNDQRLTENIENEDTKNKTKSQTAKNKYVENNDEMQPSKSKNIPNADNKHKNDRFLKNKQKKSKTKTSKTDTETENTKYEYEINENEDQNESSEVQSVQYTLMDYLTQNRPEFISAAEYRRQMLLKSQQSREEQKEAKKLNFLKNNSKQSNKGKFKLFTEQEMRNINKKNYYKLPEVRGKIINQRENNLRQADRLMSNLLAKKIQKSVLNGKGRFPIDQSLTSL